MVEGLQWAAESGLDASQPVKRSIAQNDLRRVIDSHRASTHRIFNVREMLNDRMMTRDSHFPYKEDKNQKRTYGKKMMELKVELYSEQSAKAAHANRKRIGTKEINLSDYIGKGAVTECFRMHSDAKTDNVYLTVTIQILSQKDLEDAANRSPKIGVGSTIVGGGLNSIRGTEAITAAESITLLEDSDDEMEMKSTSMLSGRKTQMQTTQDRSFHDKSGSVDRFSLNSVDVIQTQMQRITTYAGNPKKLKEEVDKLTE